MFDPIIVEKESLKIVRDAFVDDIHTGGSQSDINGMMGTLHKSGIFTGTIPR